MVEVRQKSNKKKICNSENSLKKTICEIFTRSQHTVAVHQRNSILLKQIYDESNHEEFWSNFKRILTIILVTDCSSIDKVLSFIGTFCSLLKPNIPGAENLDDDEEHPLITEIISFALKSSVLKEDNIRIRSCQIINIVLDSLVGTEVSEALCEQLEENLLARLKDPKNIVRQQAVIALHRLQDPSNPEDLIISEFIQLMNTDSYPKVRQTCVERIGVRKDVVGHILIKIRDQDQNVRLAAFKRLSNHSSFLKIEEKQLVLHLGFIDKSPKVTDYMSTLLKTWLDSYSGDILKFMESITLDSDEKDLKNTSELFESVLQNIFQNNQVSTLTEVLSLNQDHLVPIEKLDWVTVSYWRIFIEYLSKNNMDDELDKVAPELIQFCKYIKEYYLDMPKQVTSDEFLKQQFTIKELFLITKTFDFGDVTHRKCLNALVANILENVVLIADVTEIIVSNLALTISNPTQQTLFVSELISEILCPMNTEEEQRLQGERDYQISKLKVQLNKLKEDQETAVSAQNYIEADRLKSELLKLKGELEKLMNSEPEGQKMEKKTDVATLVKCLDIAAAILSFPKISQFTPSLKTLKEDFIHELLIHDNDNVRVKALRCYGLCCIIDKETAATGIHIFSTPIFAYQNGEECDTQTLLVCIAAVVDMLRIYGAQLMAARNSEILSESMDEQQQAIFAGGTSLTSILQGLVDLMDDDEYDIQEQAGRGLCQLVLSNRIVSPSLISRLVLKWCNPASDTGCNRLKQVIGFSLQKIPSMSDCSEQLIETVFLTMTALSRAPLGSPLADVKVDNIGKFLLALCNMSPNADHINMKIASRILKEIFEEPENDVNRLNAKLLVTIEVPENQNDIEELISYCEDAREAITDKQILRNIVKFTAKLNSKLLEMDQGQSREDVLEEVEEEENMA